MSSEIIKLAVHLLNIKDVSNYAIAKATGISKPTIAKYRSGSTTPNELYAEKIVKFLTNSEDSCCDNETEPTNLNITDMDIRNLLTAIERHGETLRMSNEELARQGARLDRVLDIIAPFKQTKVG